MTKRQNGILWRLARLHPGWVFLLYWAVLAIFLDLSDSPAREDSLLGSLGKAGGLLFLMSYPLFVLLFVSGRFASPSRRRVWLPLAAIGVVGTFGLFVVCLVIFPEALEVIKAGDLVIQFALWTLLTACLLSIFYLWVGGALALVLAERGYDYSLGQAFWTFLLFLYLPFFGLYFLHRRVRRLVRSAGEQAMETL
jgi:hypothetical protein